MDVNRIRTSIVIARSRWFVVALVALASAARAQGPTLQFVGGVNTPGTAVAVAVSGDRAYVADDAPGLQIVDVADPAAPAIVGSFLSTGGARDVEVSGTVAFVAFGRELVREFTGLHGIETADPANPFPILAYPVDVASDRVGVAGSIALSGARLFTHMAPPSSVSSLQTLDISNPAFPGLLGEFQGPYHPNSLVHDARGSFVLASYFDRLIVYSVSDGGALKRTSITSDSGYIRCAAIRRNGFFVVGYSDAGGQTIDEGALRVYDGAPSATLTLRAALYTPADIGWIESVAFSDSEQYAVVGLSSRRIGLVDVSEALTQFATLNLTALTPVNGLPRGIRVLGDLVYVADEAGLRIFRLMP
jgi:hypothetical protein